MIRLAVTGHRPDKLGREYNLVGPYSDHIRAELRKIVDLYLKAVSPQMIVPISGMALGVDMLWAQVAIEYRLKWIAAIPCIGQAAKWPAVSVALYQQLLSSPLCTVHHVHNGPYTPWCMQYRNEWMVNATTKLIAVWDGSKGGTLNCIKYAREKQKEILYIDPDYRKGTVPVTDRM